MVEMKAETAEPDPSATSLTNDETLNTEGSVAGTVIPKEVHTGAAPTLEEVTKVINDVEKQKIANGTSTDAAVKTEGHAAPAGEVAVEAEKKEITHEVENEEGSSHEENKTEPASRRGGNPRNSHSTNRKHNNPQKLYKNFRDNVKSDFSAQEESSDPVEIRKQVFGTIQSAYISH